MDTKEFQKLCANAVTAIDNKYGIERNPHLSFTQLSEELGELARAINLPKLRGKKLDQDNLNEEFADVLMQLAILAKIHDVDFEGAVISKIDELKKRHGLSDGDIT